MPSDLRVLVLADAAPPVRHDRSVRVRRLDERDRDDLAKLYLRSYPPDVGARDLDTARSEIDDTFAGEYGVLRRDTSLVAEVDGAPAGAVLVVEESIWDRGLPGPFVIDLFVAPEHRGRGVGRALMAQAIAACTEHGDRRLSLRVGEGTSAAAHALYASLGFHDRRDADGVEK